MLSLKQHMKGMDQSHMEPDPRRAALHPVAGQTQAVLPEGPWFPLEKGTQ